MSLAQIIGQDAAVAALRTAIARDAVPQTLLFVGPDGVGKTATAVEFAKALECRSRTPDGDACDSCANCRRIDAGEHPDVVRIAPDGEFTRIWQFWSRPGHPPGAMETLSFAPVAAPKRVYLIEKGETLNEESANSILKALEEPPGYVQFVLCAPAPTSVLPTILSRCQVVRFRQAPVETIARALASRRDLPEGEARVLAAYSGGAPGRAFRLADAPELKAQRENLLDLAARIAQSPGIAAFKLAEDLRNGAKPGGGAKGKKSAAGGDEDGGDGGADRTARGDLSRAIDVLCAWHEDMLALTLGGESAPVVHEDRRAQLIEAVRRYPRPEQIAENVETLFAFRRHVARNANAQLATEVLMMKLVPKKAAPAAAQAG
jgi:DNA polymerase-3 subunit delta'